MFYFTSTTKGRTLEANIRTFQFCAKHKQKQDATINYMIGEAIQVLMVAVQYECVFMYPKTKKF